MQESQGSLEKALCAVPLPMPVSLQTLLQDRPSERRVAILAASTATLGRPILLPLALTFLIPARTRSAIKLRSSSATAPRTVKTIFPVGRDRPGGSVELPDCDGAE